MDTVADKIKALEEAGLKRELPPVEGPQGPRVTIEGKEVLSLCSNDYLGLANDPALIEASVAETKKSGTGSGASRLVTGTMSAHRLLEDAAARFKGTEAALLFNSGYHANVGTIPALVGRGGEIFSDKLNHASIIDGAVLSRARLSRYPHLDTSALEGLLKKSTAKTKLIVTDGLFSMDGDTADLAEVARLAEKYDALLLIDDAHATGVLGEKGRGTLSAVEGKLDADRLRIIQMATFSKALGSFGAAIAGSSAVIELLTNCARSFIFTTALPPGVCAASLKALALVDEEPERRERVKLNSKRLRDGLNSLGLDTGPSTTQIIPVIIGDAGKAVAASKRLLASGVFVQAIRPPTVPEGTARLRVTVTAKHTDEDIDTAIAAFKEAL